jgi:hypothetical protein
VHTYSELTCTASGTGNWEQIERKWKNENFIFGLSPQLDCREIIESYDSIHMNILYYKLVDTAHLNFIILYVDMKNWLSYEILMKIHNIWLHIYQQVMNQRKQKNVVIFYALSSHRWCTWLEFPYPLWPTCSSPNAQKGLFSLFLTCTVPLHRYNYIYHIW